MSEFHRPGSWGRHSRTWSPGGTLPVGDSQWQQAAATTPPTHGSIFTRIGVSHLSVISPLTALRRAVYLNILVKMRYQLVLLADRPSWAFFPLSSNPPLIQRFHRGKTFVTILRSNPLFTSRRRQLMASTMGHLISSGAFTSLQSFTFRYNCNRSLLLCNSHCSTFLNKWMFGTIME